MSSQPPPKPPGGAAPGPSHSSHHHQAPKRPHPAPHSEDPAKRLILAQGQKPGPSSAPGATNPNYAPTDLDVKQHLLNYQRYFQQATYPYINDVNDYEKLCKIGQGTFGEVFKGRCKKTGAMVALKKILMENEKEGFPITALREVKMLEQLKHNNITELLEVCVSKESNTQDRTTFYLVFVFYEHDLAGLLSNAKVRMSLVHIKTLIKHLICGLNKLHRSKILHRDMKAANVLISRDGVLKLADFGLARPHGAGGAVGNYPRPLYTNRVVTLWYRPPELLLGDRQYGSKIDVWGAGCIMAEMWTRQPIMQGDTEQRQLLLISALLGSINKAVWPKCDKMPLWSSMQDSLPQGKHRMLHHKLSKLIIFDVNDGTKPPVEGIPKGFEGKTDEEAMRLLESLLSIDPEKRPTADEAEDDIWFYKPPMPTENVQDLMDTIPCSQFEYTVGKGAHANRGRPPANAPRPQPTRHVSAAIPAGQYRDTIF